MSTISSEETSRARGQRTARNNRQSNRRQSNRNHIGRNWMVLASAATAISAFTGGALYYNNQQSGKSEFTSLKSINPQVFLDIKKFELNENDLEVCLSGCKNEGKEGAKCHIVNMDEDSVHSITDDHLAGLEQRFPGRGFKVAFINEVHSSRLYSLICCPKPVTWVGILSKEGSEVALKTNDYETLYKHHLKLGQLTIGHQLSFFGIDVSNQREAFLKQFSKFSSFGRFNLEFLKKKGCELLPVEDTCQAKPSVSSTAVMISCEDEAEAVRL